MQLMAPSITATWRQFVQQDIAEARGYLQDLFPDLHIVLHYLAQAAEYVLVLNLHVLIGEDKHR
jgi:hypothetical protein